MTSNETTALIDGHITATLDLLVEQGFPVQCVLAGAWAAVSRTMIDKWGAAITAKQHENMAASIRKAISAAARDLAATPPAGNG